MRDAVAGPDGSALSEGLGPALEDAAYDCLSLLASVETYDINLRDHPEAWAAIEALAAKVRAAERKRCAKLLREAEGPNVRGNAPDTARTKGPEAR